MPSTNPTLLASLLMLALGLGCTEQPQTSVQTGDAGDGAGSCEGSTQTLKNWTDVPDEFESSPEDLLAPLFALTEWSLERNDGSVELVSLRLGPEPLLAADSPEVPATGGSASVSMSDGGGATATSYQYGTTRRQSLPPGKDPDGSCDMKLIFLYTTLALDGGEALSGAGTATISGDEFDLGIHFTIYDFSSSSPAEFVHTPLDAPILTGSLRKNSSGGYDGTLYEQITYDCDEDPGPSCNTHEKVSIGELSSL